MNKKALAVVFCALLLPTVPLVTATTEPTTGEDKETNAAIMESVLRGAPSPYFDVSILSAGTGIYTAGKAETIAEGVDIARESIMSGSAMQILEALRDLTFG